MLGLDRPDHQEISIILTRAEILRAFNGSLQLARGNATGLRAFDTSMEGFWRSFLVVFLVAPLYLVAEHAELSLTRDFGAEPVEPDLSFYLARLTTLGLIWIAYPVVMVFLARLLKLGHRYAAYIVVYNWTSLLTILVMMPPVLLYAIGLIPGALAVLLNLAATLWVLYYRFYVARTALETTVPTAIGLVLVDVLLSLTIDLASGRF